jgi:hypothetical protein
VFEEAFVEEALDAIQALTYVVQGEERLREELNQLMWDKILERV